MRPGATIGSADQVTCFDGATIRQNKGRLPPPVRIAMAYENWNDGSSLDLWQDGNRSGCPKFNRKWTLMPLLPLFDISPACTPPEKRLQAPIALHITTMKREPADVGHGLEMKSGKAPQQLYIQNCN